MPAGGLTLPRPEIDYRPARPVRWPPPTQVSVAVGAAHSAVVTLKGQVFVQGLNNYGQLGVGSRRNEFRPLRVTALEVTRVTAVSCGFWHTGFLTERQQVWALIRNAGGSQPLPRF